MAESGPSPDNVSAKIDGTTFANTKQHVVDKQPVGGEVERFANTKLNVALINDPKNGPRFTMTKREAGLEENDNSKKNTEASPLETEPCEPAAAAQSDEPASTEASSVKQKLEQNPKSAVGSGSDDTSQDAPSRLPSEPAVSTTSPLAPGDAPPGPVPPSQVPIDSSKTFVGPNGTYYDESWRWMDWRGTHQSWNWPAALSLGHWFAYRRLYGFAGLYLLFLAGLAAATVNNVPILALAALALLAVGLTGIYGNTLYFRTFRRAVNRVTKTGKGSYEELNDQLAAAGGTSVAASAVMGTLTLGGIAAALSITHNLRGDFVFNLWPL